eukprot:PhF_6_TR40700/c2_g1_i1/m.61187
MLQSTTWKCTVCENLNYNTSGKCYKCTSSRNALQHPTGPTTSQWSPDDHFSHPPPHHSSILSSVEEQRLKDLDNAMRNLNVLAKQKYGASDYDSLLKEKLELESDCRKYLNGIDKLKAFTLDQQETISSLESKLSSCLDERDSLLTEGYHVRTELTSCKKLLDEKDALIKELSTKIDLLQRQLFELDSTERALKKEALTNKYISEKLNQTELTAKEWQHKVETLEGEVSQLRADVVVREEIHKTHLDALKTENHSLLGQIAKLKDVAQSYMEETRNARLSIQSMERHNYDQRSIVETLQSTLKVQSLEHEKDSLECTKMSNLLQMHVHEEEHLRNLLGASQERVRVLLEEAAERQDENAKVLETMSLTTSALRETINFLETENRSLTQKLHQVGYKNSRDVYLSHGGGGESGAHRSVSPRKERSVE